MSLKPIYKAIPTEDPFTEDSMQKQYFYLEPQDVEIKIYKLKEKIYKFAIKHYDKFEIEQLCKSNMVSSNTFLNLCKKHENYYIKDMFLLLYICTHSSNYYSKVTVNWLKFHKFIYQYTLQLNKRSIEKYNNNLISTYLLDETRQMLLKLTK